jgi:hypothetical protein
MPCVEQVALGGYFDRLSSASTALAVSCCIKLCSNILLMPITTAKRDIMQAARPGLVANARRLVSNR